MGQRLPSRRSFLAALPVAVPLARAATTFDKSPNKNLDVGIVGAGLAGLVCADQLKSKGITATLFDSSARACGRCHSLRNFFPGQVAERGAEFIHASHKTMLALARRFTLPLEDASKQPGETRYFFRNEVHSEETIASEFRTLAKFVRDDLRQLSPEVTARKCTPIDRRFDRMSLTEYLETRGASPLLRAFLEESCTAEYGISAGEQSCLNFLHSHRHSKDARFHVIGGNDRIAEGLARGLAASIRPAMRLLRVRKNAQSRIELTFAQDKRTATTTHDAVVLAIPFSTLRHVELDSSLRLVEDKLNAIEHLGYGTATKTILGFDQRPWLHLYNSSGASYADLPHLQCTWETNPIYSTASRAILTHLSSATRSIAADPAKILADLEVIYPGSSATATRRVHVENWAMNANAKGSYSGYRTGQFTTIAGLEAEPAGNLFFAGEHTNSFYESQGFMEGACLSGLDAATQILTG